MPNKIFILFSVLNVLLFCNVTIAQVDTTNKITDSTSRKNILSLDTSAKKYNPKIATFRSAVLPGWGQAYNKKYWKIPIIYGALGTTAGIFLYNLKTYKQLKTAIILRSDTDVGNDSLVDKKFRLLSTESIRTYRNSFRQNVDYSVLVFLVFWGLNVVDATVDAHLKSFDVSDKISLRIRPGYQPLAKSGGISLLFSFKDRPSNVLTSLR
jgi:hypothetical protein